MKVLKYLFVIIIATPLQSYRRYIIIEEDNGSLEKHHIRKENKYDEYAMLLTQRFARIPMQSPAQVKLKRKQVDKFEKAKEMGTTLASLYKEYLKKESIF